MQIQAGTGRHPSFRCLWPLLISVLLLWPGLAWAQPTDDPLTTARRGTVSGQITQGTAGGAAVPANMEVTLLLLNAGVVEAEYSAQAGADGRFNFRDVPLAAGVTYIANTIYRERSFSSEFLVAEVTSDALNLPITIYELTEDRSVISIAETVIQIIASGETLEFRQSLRFINSADRLFTSSGDLGGGRFPSLAISLPPGSQPVGYDDANRYVSSPETFTVVDTAPVLPGDQHQAVVVYIQPYDGRSALIEQQVNYPFNGTARLLVWPETLTISGDGFAEDGSETLGDRTYRRYTATVALAAASALRYEIGGAAALVAQQTPVNTESILLGLIGIVGVGALVVALALYLRGRGSPLTR
ncbi:MAG: hypothetical protein JNJ61_22630 [Anaerolineae bacterium]|nr:hypothetical protein [Anaerolineae bacterium]